MAIKKSATYLQKWVLRHDPACAYCRSGPSCDLLNKSELGIVRALEGSGVQKKHPSIRPRVRSRENVHLKKRQRGWRGRKKK